MGFLQKCIILCQTTQKIIILILFFFFILLSSSHMKFLAEGRVMAIKADVSQKYVIEEKIVQMRYLIGSIPPKCDKRRCVSCGHCVAVQVPIVPRIKHDNLKSVDAHRLQFYGSTPSIAYSRGDGISNYKPMCWKCKCGDYIFNP